MSFDIEGFTGISGTSIRTTQLKNFEELFTFAKTCSELAIEITLLLPEATDKTQLTACLFFARSTSHFQAAMCLAEGGMTIESLVLCRGLFETFFVLNALADGAVTPAQLLIYDRNSRKNKLKLF